MDNWAFRFDNTPYRDNEGNAGTVNYILPFDDLPIYPYSPRLIKAQTPFTTYTGKTYMDNKHILREVSMRWDSAELVVKDMLELLFIENLPFDFYEDVHNVRATRRFFPSDPTRCLLISESFSPRELVDESYAFSIRIRETDGEEL